MIWYLIRHGQSVGNAQFGHGADPPLTDLGREQARLTGLRLAGEAQVDHLVASTMRRAAETARMIGEILGAEPVLAEWLREHDVAPFAGKPLEEIEAAWPGRWREELWDDWEWRTPQGETFRNVYERVAAGAEALKREHVGETLAIVSHGCAGSFLMGYLLGGQEDAFSRFGWSNCGISCVEFRRGRAHLRYHNDCRHLLDAGG